MARSRPSEPLKKRKLGNGAIAAACALGAVAMVGAAYAAVPLYKRFCQLTGFDGTTKRAEAAPAAGAAAGKLITVRFDTNVRGDLPWTFQPLQVSEPTRIGTPSIAFFRVRNDGPVAITGRATFNLAPSSAAAYFVKTQCFCFSDQTIGPGQEMKFPVIYYIEPGFSTDRDTREFQEVTLSYTFFRSPQPSRGRDAAETGGREILRIKETKPLAESRTGGYSVPKRSSP